MTTSVRELLASELPQSAVGRERDLDRLARCLEPDGPVVTWVHGLPGIGKTELVELLERSVLSTGRELVRFDCRLIEPTPAAVTEVLAAANPAGDAIIVFDNYESFRLVDSWLRRSMVPSLPASTRVILVSREAPSTGWLSSTAWRKLFSELYLGPLGEEAVDEYLAGRGVDADEAIRIARWAQGHPLALALAANASGSDYLQSGSDDIHARLAACFLDEIQEPTIRDALEACSVVRRITRPVLEALTNHDDPAALYANLASLSFVEVSSDGLAVHDLIREAIASELRAADPARYRRCQQTAWRLHRDQLRDSTTTELWRNTSDTIYLLSNPVVREAFFPSEMSDYVVEPAASEDSQAILEIVERHETPASAAALRLWCDRLPRAFYVVRNRDGVVDGFYVVAQPDDLGSDWLREDPVAAAWLDNLAEARSKPPALFLRRWLSREGGEAPGPVQGAAWLDIKRMYLELRPELRRVYLCLNGLGPYAEAATQLGFVVLDSARVEVDGEPVHTAMLDFGPGSVDGWINQLLATEMGMSDDQLLDHAAHELVIDGLRIALTPLEFGVIALLESRGGEAVPRDLLIHEVWGRDYTGGSNVVDAVVRGLRKKCGDSAWLVETVRGVGYRLGSPPR